MSDNLFLKPGVSRDGTELVVRDPSTGGILASTGEWRERTPFWTRRLADKDVIDATPKNGHDNSKPDLRKPGGAS